MVTTRSTVYPSSRQISTAYNADAPVVVTSSNTVILLPSGGNGPSTCDSVQCPLGFLRIMRASNGLHVWNECIATADTSGSAPSVRPATALISLSM